MSLYEDIEALANSLELELYDISTLKENDESIFRVSVVSKNMVDGKKEAVNLDKCVELTHLLSPLLDVDEPMSGEYRLEVGSAGIERKISTLKQFELSIGESVQISLRDKTKYSGVIKSVEDNTITLEDGSSVDFAQVSKAKTFFTW
ncbi:MAG: ribosome maturation factor [Sulfurimonadaceae bacterium]|nr:ribosome maturation factor [Sulfurimonadaceae bacterium]